MLKNKKKKKKITEKNKETNKKHLNKNKIQTDGQFKHNMQK
jgi:hypothetical protein